MKIISLLIIYILFSAASFSQNIYNVGTAKTSIEPGNDLISLALGGYAAPWEGRFTLQWKEIESLPDFTTISGSGDLLYIISDGRLLGKKVKVDTKGASNEWKEVTKTDNIKLISGDGNRLLAINRNGELMLSVTDKRKLTWSKINSFDFPVKTFTVFGDSVYLADEKGEFWICDISGRNPTWKKTEIQKLENVIDLAANSNKLVALTDDGSMYQFGGKERDYKWIKIAYKNGITIKEDIHDIVMLNNRICGIDADNILYAGEHRSEGGLSAQAVSINDGESTIIIIGLDLTGIDYTFTKIVKEEIFNSSGIPPSAIFINATHTHFAPVSQNWLPWQESNRYADNRYLYVTIKDAIHEVVNESLANLHPANIYFGRANTEIGFNRSLEDHPEIYDSDADVIKIDYLDSKEESYIFMASCHPVQSTSGTLHYTISANYPGVARKLVEERTNSTNSIFLQGTAGDINPVDNGQYITGEKLANEVISLLGKPMKQISGPISFFFDTKNIPIEPKSREEIEAFKEQNMGKTNDMISERNSNWSSLMLKYYDNGTMPNSIPVHIQTINIGSWKLIGLSREVTSEYGLGIKDIWPEKLVSVVGYTNDVSSYLPTNLHIENRKYEGWESFCWYGMPSTFPVNVKDTLLSFIKRNNR